MLTLSRYLILCETLHYGVVFADGATVKLTTFNGVAFRQRTTNEGKHGMRNQLTVKLP